AIYEGVGFDPESRAGEATPAVLADRGGNSRTNRIEHVREAETEPHAFVDGLAEATDRDLRELAVVGQVIGSHVLHRARPENTDAFELPAPAHHLCEAEVIRNG